MLQNEDTSEQDGLDDFTMRAKPPGSGESKKRRVKVMLPKQGNKRLDEGDDDLNVLL